MAFNEINSTIDSKVIQESRTHSWEWSKIQSILLLAQDTLEKNRRYETPGQVAITFSSSGEANEILLTKQHMSIYNRSQLNITW